MRRAALWLAPLGLWVSALVLAVSCIGPPGNPAEPEPAPVAVEPWVLQGRCVRVSDGREIPVPNARVEIRCGGFIDDYVYRIGDGAPSGGGAEPTKCFQVVADQDGRFDADLTPLRRRSAQARLEGSSCLARADGYAMRDVVRIHDLPLDADQRYRGTIKLVLRPCATITGRVVDPRGRPVGGATVSSEELEVGAKPMAARMHSHRETFEGCTFAIPCFETARVEVRAFASAVGVAPWTEVDVRPPATVRVPDLVLRPLGVISGCARFPDGSPAPHVDLVWEEALNIARDRDATGREGVFRSVVRTDEQGRFAIRSLQPGSYKVYPVDRSLAGWELAETRAETGDRSVEVRIERQLLSLIFRDARGRPWLRHANASLRSWDPPHADPAARLHASGQDPKTLPHRWICANNERGGEGADRVNVFLAPGSYHHLTIGYCGLEPKSQVIRFKPREWRKEVQLTQTASDRLAYLSVTLRDEAGVELTDKRLRLEPINSVSFGDTTWEIYEPSRTAEPVCVGPGRYHLRTEYPFPQFHFFKEELKVEPERWQTMRCAFLPVEREVTLTAGANHIDLRTKRNAFVRARFHTSGSPDGGRSDLALTVRSRTFHKRISLRRLSLSFGAEIYAHDWLPVPPGDYELLLHVPGRRPAKKKVKLGVGSIGIVEFGKDEDEGGGE